MFIAMCGINGSGKSVQARLLKNHFDSQGKKCAIVKAYNETAKQTCRSFLETWENDIAVTFLFQALQSQQYMRTKRLLAEGHIVIADRWDESFLAHHSNFGFLANQQKLRDALNTATYQNLTPDVGILLCLPPAVAAGRRNTRADKVKRFGNRSGSYYEVIQQSYLEIAYEREWKIIDGTQSPTEIHVQILDLLTEKGLFP